MTGIFDYIAIPLGYVLNFIYSLVNNYFVAIFLFTLLTRILMFPLSLNSQKAQVKRMKLAPRLERLQKKYAKDPKKLQEKQMALYEKHGVSMTGGCLPMVVQMVLLFGIISAIYKPLTHLVQIPDEVIAASTSAITLKEDEKVTDENSFKLKESEMQGYYGELNMLSSLHKEGAEEAIRTSIDKLAKDKPEVMDGKTTDDYIQLMNATYDEFEIFGVSVLDNPAKDGWTPNWLWLIGVLSGLTALASSLLTSHYTKLSQGGQKQPGQGCSNGMLMLFMPLFSLVITFTVPGGVGIYWIFSNIISIGQTYLLNRIYDPVKIRAEAEREYEELRRKKAEDKKRLAEARKREQAELQKAINEENEHGNKKKSSKKPTKKPAESKADEAVTESVEDAPEEVIETQPDTDTDAE